MTFLSRYQEFDLVNVAAFYLPQDAQETQKISCAGNSLSALYFIKNIFLDFEFWRAKVNQYTVFNAGCAQIPQQLGRMFV